jgi:multidrug efflux pump subunit AcrA (membrane-fusion protein)
VVYVAPSLVSGGSFRRGQTLVRIDPADYRNAVEQARAAVAQREVEVLQAEQQRRIAQEEIERFEQRAGIDVPAPETEAGALAARLPQVEAAQAALQSAQAQLNDAQLRLARTTVEAPFDGQVRSKEIGEGAYVTPGQPLATIYPTDELEVPVSLSPSEAALIPDLFATEADPGRTDIGARVRATFGGEEYAWRGYVDRAESALDPQSRTVTAVVRVPDPYALGVTRTPDENPATGPSGRPPLLIDQYVTVEIEGRPFDRFVAVPREALRERGEPSVWTVQDDSILVEEPVEVIQAAGDRVFVRGDIAPGLPVITNDLAVQTDRMTVRVAADTATVAPPTGAANRSGTPDTTRANRAAGGGDA